MHRHCAFVYVCMCVCVWAVYLLRDVQIDTSLVGETEPPLFVARPLSDTRETHTLSGARSERRREGRVVPSGPRQSRPTPSGPEDGV